MPPFRTSWLYLVSPFTLQRYELFPYVPNKSQSILSFFISQTCETAIFEISSLFICKVQDYFLTLQSLHAEAPLVGGTDDGGDLYIGKAYLALCA